jgi:hypothetical protein
MVSARLATASSVVSFSRVRHGPATARKFQNVAAE